MTPHGKLMITPHGYYQLIKPFFMKQLSIILTLVMLAIIGYAQPIPVPGQRPTDFPLKAVLDGSEELYSQRDINGVNNRRFLVSQILEYARCSFPLDSIYLKNDSLCIKRRNSVGCPSGNCISFNTTLQFVDSLRISNDTLYYRKNNSWRPLLLPSSGDSILYTGNDTLALYTVLTTGNTAPGSPAIGATYWVGASPTGSWAGHAQDIATWTGSAWTFYDAVQGDYMYNAATGYTYQWRTPNWVRVSGIPILNGGNSLSSGVNIGSKNAKPVVLKTNNTTRMTIQPGGAININSLASNTYPLVGAESDGTLRKIYPTNDFIVDIDSLRINPAILSGSSNISAGNGLYKSSDSIHLGGMVKSSIEFLNALNDTILGIDTLGHVYAPGLYKLEESNGGFIMDTTFTITTDYLVDSVLLSFGLLPSQFCHTPHTAGVVSKLSRKDGVLYTLDTTNTGACQDSTIYSILQLKFAGGQLPKDVFVDSFGIFFSGYDTLNVNGSTSREGSPFIIMNQGRKVIYNHFYSNDDDSIFNSLGDPFSIGEDTISFLNYHFSENVFNTIDSITISFLVPLGGNDDFKFFIDRVALVFPYKPVLRMVASWGGNLLTMPMPSNTTTTSTTYTYGNGVVPNGDAFDLGNFTDNVFVNANSKDYILSSAGQYSIDGSSITLQGNGTTNGVTLGGASTGSVGTVISGTSINSFGISMDGNSKDSYGTYISGTSSDGIKPDIEIYATNGNIRFSGVPTNNAATQVLAASASNSTLVWREISTIPGRVTAGNGLRNIGDSTVALANGGQLTDDIRWNGLDNDKSIYLYGYGNISNYSGVQIAGSNNSPSNPALYIQGNNAGTADDIIFTADNGKLRIAGLPNSNNAIALLGKTSNGLATWVSNPLTGTSSLSTNTAITMDFSTYIMDFTSSGSGTSNNRLPSLSSVPNGFTVRIRRTDNNSSFTASITPYSGDIITDIDNTTVYSIGISSGTTNNYVELTAFKNGVNGYGGSTKWVVMNKH